MNLILNLRRSAWALCDLQSLTRLGLLGLLGLASKTPHLPTFVTSSPLGSAVALEMATRVRSASLERPK